MNACWRLEENTKTELLNKVKNAVRQIEPSAEIIIYGSRARNDFSSVSDWDFLVLVDGDVDYRRTHTIRHQLHEIEWDTGEVLSCLVRNRIEWESEKYRTMPLYKSIKLEGVRL
ncbi:MAG: nucleotidyltransferase domain-containing protein [Chitinivibrionales bacterium]|nr:nucleotidyltransferase domain-containing protein [Chitinivibrionales bacterium]